MKRFVSKLDTMYIHTYLIPYHLGGNCVDSSIRRRCPQSLEVSRLRRLYFRLYYCYTIEQ